MFFVVAETQIAPLVVGGVSAPAEPVQCVWSLALLWVM